MNCQRVQDVMRRRTQREEEQEMKERERENKGTRIGNSIASKWPPEVAASANKLRMEIGFLA